MFIHCLLNPAGGLSIGNNSIRRQRKIGHLQKLSKHLSDNGSFFAHRIHVLQQYQRNVRILIGFPQCLHRLSMFLLNRDHSFCGMNHIHRDPKPPQELFGLLPDPLYIMGKDRLAFCRIDDHCAAVFKRFGKFCVGWKSGSAQSNQSCFPDQL